MKEQAYSSSEGCQVRFLSQGFLPQEGLKLPPEEEAPGQVI